jgi:ribosomal RNA-processing protein 36
MPEDAASISFGALAKAQATMIRPGGTTKKPKPRNKQDGDTWENNEALERKAGRKDHRDFNRSSKHAPTEISSKKAVSRRREVVPVAKREFRDPRFEPLSGYVDESKVRAAYSFLDEYREDEMKELKSAIKTTKNEDAKEKLKRALISMESKKKAQMRKQKEQEILDKHRKEEKELVRQGKQPFYLKKAEQKKRVLLDQFGELTGKKLDRVIERRRKKQEGREKKKMPFKRRTVEP